MFRVQFVVTVKQTVSIYTSSVSVGAENGEEMFQNGRSSHEIVSRGI